MIDVLALLAVAGFAALGWARGAKAMGLWGVSLVAGSVAGALLARPAGMWMSAAAGMPLLISIPLAGAVIMGVVTGGLRAAARRVGRERALRLQDGWEPPTWDRWGGSALGTLCGVGIVLFAGWVGNATGSLHGRQAELRSSLVGRASAGVGEPVVRLLAGDAVGNTVMAATVAFLMSDPGQAEETLRTLAGDARVRELAGDPAIRSELEARDVAALSRAPALRSLAADPAFVSAARRVRILSEGSGPTVTADELAEAVSQRLGPLAEVAQALARDSTVKATLDDPAFKDALARGDLVGFLARGDLDGLLQSVSREIQRNR